MTKAKKSVPDPAATFPPGSPGADAALEQGPPVEVDTDDESPLEEHDHAEFYDDEEDALEEPDFDAPEQNAKETS